ncbi:hypothetical protein LIER_10186 [Lithospermum erythrorhizon]|uniref:Uncharacterized protein n=1 Tax=Lithospermum erythrorhizon TaxID=34254 RepID=A0AAV3PL91_LITER
MASTGGVKNGFDLSSDPTVDNNIQTNLSIGFKPQMRSNFEETDFKLQSLHNHQDNATPREAKNCDRSPDMNGQQLALYQPSQMHDLPRLQSQGNQTSQHQSLPTYQQQVQQLPQSSVQPQVKLSSAFPYLSYMPRIHCMLSTTVIIKCCWLLFSFSFMVFSTGC